MTEKSLADELEDGEAVLAPEDEATLAAALRAAHAPSELAPARHAEILRLALEDPFAPASADELRASERLRAALENGDAAHPDAALARALAAAVKPAELEPSAARRTREGVGARRPNVVYVTFGALALAAAAAFALFVARPSADAPEPHVALVPSHTTEALFHEAFVTGAASERIDRIASARERDARENRYALWGVR
ncbi:MAG TPA: hypothetical protein VMI54_02360 [Polyangiaceae bacterium]|nr:hypothetical protein [Polyangiaceae bacterium]